MFSDNVAMRGERLELLVNKADNLSSSSVTFRAQSRTLQRSLFWKNIKLYLILAGIAMVSNKHIFDMVKLLLRMQNMNNFLIYCTSGSWNLYKLRAVCNFRLQRHIVIILNVAIYYNTICSF